MRYLESHSHDPRWNLALEQYLFDHADRSCGYLMLWQNENTIVVGKYQNTVGEINNEYVREKNISVVRRLSGGGAVYHDLGNLNFTFIVDASDAERINFRMFCEPVMRALATFGVTAELSGRNDITVDGKKISGNAQYLREGRVMHHGTILFDSDPAIIGNALRVDREKLASKGVKSVVSRVTNLRAHLPEGTTLADFKARLVEELGKSEPMEQMTLSEEALARIDQIKRERYDTWEWNYGRSPGYTDTRRRRIEGVGTVEAALAVKNEVIREIRFFGDFFAEGEVSELEQKLVGCRCEREALLARLADCDCGTYIRNLTVVELVELLLA
ncbi:MAG: lipoate--protein ligase [Oscillospiraceae bacterium]|nr:lipoate--protein ligase [Oscillospiraceae bacterium]